MCVCTSSALGTPSQPGLFTCGGYCTYRQEEVDFCSYPYCNMPKNIEDCPGGIKCPHCGICNPEGSSYCGHCRWPLKGRVFTITVVVVGSVDNPLKCEDCGKELKTLFERLVGLCIECWKKRKSEGD